MPFVELTTFDPAKAFQAHSLWWITFCLGPTLPSARGLSHEHRGYAHHPGVMPHVGTCHSAPATATIGPKECYLNDCSYDLDSIFVKHRFPPKKLNK